MIIDSYLYDVGFNHGSIEAVTKDIIDRTKASWASGADMVVFPEYSWCNFMLYSSPGDALEPVAKSFWSLAWPRLKAELSQSGKAVILGSVPYVLSDGKIRNRTPMLIEGHEIFQDKLCLTPWEAHLDGGDELSLFNFKGAKCANLICLDIEIPATASMLKEEGGIDLVFVPSATETMMGVERIARCASSRAVELGAAVVVSQLVGELDNEFIGENLGQAALYLPSLAATDSVTRVDERGIVRAGHKAERFEVDLGLLRAARADTITTNPALVKTAKNLSIKLAN